MSCGVGQGNGSDPTLLWLWHRPSATVLDQPLAWEPLYAVGMALKEQKRKKRNKEKRKQAGIHVSMMITLYPYV